MVGKQWGLNPKTTHWVYTSIVRPLLTYGSVVWATGLDKKGNKLILTRIQRLACKMITGSMHSTPTAGMEILLGLRPIEIELKAAALSTCIRLVRAGHWLSDNQVTKSHTKRLNEIRENIPELHFPQDKSSRKIRSKNKFYTCIRNRIEFVNEIIRPRPTETWKLNCFTDGSKTDNGAGASYYMMGHDAYFDSFKRQESIHLGQFATVFQAEVTAISRATLKMIEENITGKFINFYIDSQSAIKALASYSTRQKSVADGKRALNKLVELGNDVTLNWIPGHSGQPGNTIADHLAKNGAENGDWGLEPRLPVSECVIKSIINKWKDEEHSRTWEQREDCRQTKLVLPEVKHNWGEKILEQGKGMRVLTQLVTGHANLKRHRNIMGMEEDDICDFCGDSQTAIHILTDCPRFLELRRSKFGNRIIDATAIKHIKLSKIVQFASGTSLWPYLNVE